MKKREILSPAKRITRTMENLLSAVETFQRTQLIELVKRIASVSVAKKLQKKYHALHLN